MTEDQVQKNFRIDTKSFNRLKKQDLVEGTPTKGRLSLEIAKTIDKVDEEDKKTQVYDFRATFESLILTPLKTYKDGMSLQEIIDYVHYHLPYTKEFDQKKLRKDISNSLQKLKKSSKILSFGNNKLAKYKKSS